MNGKGTNILVRFQNKWRSFLWLQTFFVAIGPAVLVYFLSHNLLYAFATLVTVGFFTALWIKPWYPDKIQVSRYIDSKIDHAEYSTGLFLIPTTELSGLAQLQREKIAERLRPTLDGLKPPNRLGMSAVLAGALIVLALVGQQSNWMGVLNSTKQSIPLENAVVFMGQDTITSKFTIPKLVEQQLTINFPGYTRLGSRSTTAMDVKAVKGSRLYWKLKFDREVQNVRMQSMGNEYDMTEANGYYVRNNLIESSGFYNFKFEDLDGNSYSSDLYGIEAVSDTPPEIEIKNLDQFTSFDYSEEKIIVFNTHITDDFGIADSYIIATVSKGSGESVKFREEKMTFERGLAKGAKRLKLPKSINLDRLKLEPGDELYFYVEALDQKSPNPNYSRSETFFAAVKDTVSEAFGVEGTLGVDRMPDYFRSQRQLIIDTEKLIKEKPQLSEHDFKFKSNELGFDQKALRLKYGAFMGEESEVALEVSEDIEDLDVGEDHGDDHSDEEDPLAEYTHDHDGDNEHNLVVDSEKEKDKSKNPLQEFMHDHGDPEMATLFEESLKVKLLKALAEMWDAELYLRLYKPAESLPYQYKALKLIQEIKNDARIYVHRIGFDPPPIKEDKRLTGELKDVNSFSKTADIEYEDAYVNMRNAAATLEDLIDSEQKPLEKDLIVFELAGDELAGLAIKSPGKYLNTLQALSRLINGADTSLEAMIQLRKGLLIAMPKSAVQPHSETRFLNEIDRILLNELELND